MGEWHRSRWIWNHCLTENAARKDRRAHIGGKDLTAARCALPWLAAGAVTPQQQTLRTFAGKGRRNFKHAKKALPSLEYTRNGFSLKDGRLRLAGGWLIPVVWSRELASEPSSVRAYQRCMARRKPTPGKSGSHGYFTAKHQAARLHKKVARQRQHTSRQWARRVVAGNQLIAVEDFRTKFLFQSTMARKAADNAAGAAKRELVSYALRAGRTVVIVPPAYTTMTRRQCGTRAKDRLALSQRTFQCWSCGYTDGRDRNAARTILATAGRDPTRSLRGDVDAVRQRVEALVSLSVAS